MKSISKQLHDAIIYYKEHPEESITQVAIKFNADRHGLAAHLNDYQLYKYEYQEKYYYITDEEMEPVTYYLEHPDCSFNDVTRIYGTQGGTIKRRLMVIGREDIATEKRYKRKFNRNAFSDIQTEEDAYWLGFILADGYINEDRGFLKIKLGIVDENHLKKFGKYMQEKNPPLVYETGGAKTRDNPVVGIEYNSRELVNNLKQWNLFQGKSGQEQPIILEDLNLTKAYVRGMIDGDGHVEKGYFKYVGSLTSCQYIKNFFKNYYHFNDDNKYIYPHGTIYSFELRNSIVNTILTDIYQNASIYLDRKYNVVINELLPCINRGIKLEG